ncbi:MAG: restriction endonuclease subunit S [Burkholderiales bacterium]|jgi:type I restriction enzyme S subunit|nr:restriction endonuclease subunit S [Burkholderiales bacterium]
MAGEWPSLTVGELADSVSDTHKFAKDHLIFLNTSDVLLGKILHRTYSAVRDWPGQAKKSIRREDILFSEIRPANGRWAYVDVDADDYVVSTKLMVIRSRRSRVVPRFLYHFLTSSKTTRWLQHLAESRSGTFPQITFDQVAALELALPPLEAQTTIAAFLDCISDKIELNRRMNETLEAMARSLFKSWFVDFDPVRAKAEGRDPGLPKPLADLFPARFVDSELGEIPEGWDVATLPDVVAVNPTRALRKGVEAPYLDMANMPTHGHSADEIVDRTFGSGMRFINGDTLVARITPCLENGKTAFVDFLQDGQVGWGSTEYIVLRPKSPLPEEYAYCLARSAEFRDFAIQGMTGTSGRQRVPAESLAHFRVAVPPKPVAESFGWAAKPTFARASAATRDCRTLAALRDALLPKLISGQLQVRTNAVDTLTSCASPDLDMHD